MSEQEWYYKVKIVIGTAYDDIQDPEFRFSKSEKTKMMEFIDTCLENGHEISVVLTTEQYDR
jgi:hypothetical protein